MSIVNKQFIAHFISERKRLGLTQALAAEQCGVSLKMWGLYERGENTPSGEVLLRFQEIGANIEYIFKGGKLNNTNQTQAAYTADIGNILLKALEQASSSEIDALNTIANLILNKQK